MRIAAAQRLWMLQGRLGDKALGELQKLTNMPSSIYRNEVVAMLARQRLLIESGPRNEKQAQVQLLSQVINTGEPRENGPALDLLALLDQDAAISQAR